MKKNFLEITQSIYSGYPLTGSDGADFSLDKVPALIYDGNGATLGGLANGRAINYSHVVNPEEDKIQAGITTTITATDNISLVIPAQQYKSVGDYFSIPNSPTDGISSTSFSWPPSIQAKPMFPTLTFNVKKAEGANINLAGVDKDRISVEVTQLEASASAKVTVKADETSQYWPLGNEQSFFFSKDALFDKFTAEYKDGILTLRAMKKVVPVVKPKVKTLEIE